ncbi:MAG: DUF1223 domain-containing protein [Sporocytophaga sp.]|uniref:DUF1223 domain-containing protein n=1 Tax=Sporocytophaga sp. TaxID=2231183 RepID=UPI001B0E61E4|nr:DUF1223 domain-containing protein [Sporocytophaga sp.]MBO9699922.1 DUF1223 domain-containing protein [Sporocytophaga sp.]
MFTSEGCSSCPAADELIARIQKTAANKPVYILSYHIDYWDGLGWKDVFSNPLFTQRQYEYSKRFTGLMYTPQLIINGSAEFVGSDAAVIDKEISSHLAASSPTRLTLQARQESERIAIAYKVSDVTDHKLVIALVRKNASTYVKRGENEGRKLSHVQIVHRLDFFNLSTRQGVNNIGIPNGFNTTDWEIIGFLQDPNTGAIDDAARATFLSTVSVK